jgi:hypothetical protein
MSDESRRPLLAIGVAVLTYASIAGGAFIAYWASVALFYPFPASLGIWALPAIWAIGGAFIGGSLSVFILLRRPAWRWLAWTVFGSAGVLCLAWLISQCTIRLS